MVIGPNGKFWQNHRINYKNIISNSTIINANSYHKTNANSHPKTNATAHPKTLTQIPNKFPITIPITNTNSPSKLPTTKYHHKIPYSSSINKLIQEEIKSRLSIITIQNFVREVSKERNNIFRMYYNTLISEFDNHYVEFSDSVWIIIFLFLTKIN